VKFVDGGVGVGVGAGVEEGDGESEGVGDGVGDVMPGMGISCEDTFQIHVCMTVPFSLLAIAEIFHVPVAALVFV